MLARNQGGGRGKKERLSKGLRNNDLRPPKIRRNIDGMLSRARTSEESFDPLASMNCGGVLVPYLGS